MPYIAVRSATVDFRRLYWLDLFSNSIYSIDKKHGLDMMAYPAPQRLIHIFAYSEGLQPVPGDALARQSCSYDTEQNRKALS